jgi:hypothetical protein
MAVFGNPAYTGERRHQLYCCPAFPPVDTPPRSHIFVPVSKKSSKVQEAAANYTAKKPVKAALSPKPGPVSTSDQAFKRVTDKIFSERKELLHRLAQ